MDQIQYFIIVTVLSLPIINMFMMMTAVHQNTASASSSIFRDGYGVMLLPSELGGFDFIHLYFNVSGLYLNLDQNQDEVVKFRSRKKRDSDASDFRGKNRKNAFDAFS